MMTCLMGLSFESLLKRKFARNLTRCCPHPLNSLDRFLDSSYNTLLLPGIQTLEWAEDYANGLPFLLSVCCLHAIADRPDLAQSTLRRKVYQRIRAALGLVLLDHSLSLDDIQGVLMCTDSFRAGAGVCTAVCHHPLRLCFACTDSEAFVRVGQNS